MGAEQGYGEAQACLGRVYEYGIGVPKDYAQAFGWYMAAARQGVGNAENGLGAMFANGEGVVQDKATAERLFRAAAAHGEHGGLLNIAEMYFDGVNHPSDMAAGYALAYVVSDMRDAPPDATSVRDSMGKRLDPTQLARSKRLIEKMRRQDPLAVLDAATGK
jgi:uncharacterized protein